MHLLSYFIPVTVLRTSSPYNKDIRVLEESGKMKLLCNGARESGEYIAALWRHAFRSFALASDRKTDNILVLGIAGGTVIHMLHALYPEAVITGVDIDPVIISVGKKYFGLGDLPLFRAVRGDAERFVARTPAKKFDCVVIDVFIGPDVPPFVLSPVFQRNVKKLLTPKGFVLINYLRQTGYETRAVTLETLLQSMYNHVRSDDIYNNRFFLAQ